MQSYVIEAIVNAPNADDACAVIEQGAALFPKTIELDSDVQATELEAEVGPAGYVEAAAVHKLFKNLNELENGDWRLEYQGAGGDYSVTFGGADAELRAAEYARSLTKLSKKQVRNYAPKGSKPCAFCGLAEDKKGSPHGLTKRELSAIKAVTFEKDGGSSESAYSAAVAMAKNMRDVHAKDGSERTSYNLEFIAGELTQIAAVLKEKGQ